MQNGMIERNAGLPPERRIEFRVGIHLGDVVEESDGDLMGDSVNIAARSKLPPSRGSSLFAKTIATALDRTSLSQVILDGFFARTALDDLPRETRRTGLQEFGLPYASDPVISKHLARFLTRSLQNVHSDKLGALVGSRAGGCRDLKERALSGLGSAQEHYIVALPGRGSGLVAGAQTATLARDEVERLVLDGFFPVCDARARPYRTQSGLRDWGLPYAADSAITRHLADFLRDRTRVDAVLFNGGSLHAAVLRQRVLDQIAAWQDGARPIELENAEPDLAVARGAARFGKLLHGHAGRIAAGAARAVFLPVQMAPAATNQADPPALICVLPLNAAAEQVFEINLPGLELRTDQLVSFQACSSTRHGRCRPGDVLPWDADAFHALPPLQTIIRTAHGVDVGSDRTVPVRLAAKMNALGLLQISCVGTDLQTPQSWPLEFNLRPHEHGGAAARGAPAPAPVAPNATTEAQQAARDHPYLPVRRRSPTG